MDPYLGLAEFKTAVGEDGGRGWDDQLTAALTAASSHIDLYCNDRFVAAEVAFPRTFRPRNGRRLTVGSFVTADGVSVEVDHADSGQFVAVPAGGWTPERVLHSQNDAAPLDTLAAVSPLRWPDGRSAGGFAAAGRGRVRVTARWGWATPPGDVVQACQILATGLFRAKDTTGGFAAAVRGLTAQGSATPEYVLQAHTLLDPLMRVRVDI